MLKNLNFKSLFVILSIATLSFNLQARKLVRSHDATTITANKYTQNFFEAKGIVDTKKRVRFTGAEKESMIVTLKRKDAAKEPIAIDLGDASDFVRIKEGRTKLKVVGQLRDIGEQPVLMASEVYIDGELVKLTKSANRPLQAE
ncbi:MAG: hypothetical protein CME64_16770 [Halobacteriovoraceae bacterium]|nr:hypothetical protein [Halobacteriovoraceae bacterium]|tara:strand:- start:181724 stop:182155 length:432 start_codon:yes stop_codon:yes gene_type:complete